MNQPDPVVLTLVARWQSLAARGESASLAEICRDRPDLLPEVERRIRALHHLEALGAAQPTDVPPTVPPATADYRTRGSEELPDAPPGPWPTDIPGYVILAELGRGGMGVVYKARQVALKRIVALKMILAEAQPSERQIAQLNFEAQSVARLKNQNIVQIHEIGMHQGRPFLCLEFCPGGSLDRQIGGIGWRPEPAAALVETLARAVQAAHDARIVHRDLKPANVLIAEDGTPKISDFGLAREIEEAALNRTGTVTGTPAYMAPEQIEAPKTVGPPADIYALGTILYELLTGRPPFRAASMMAQFELTLTATPVPPTRLAPEVPRDLETVCLKCLEKDPARRYPSARALADDLRRWLDKRPIHARPAGPAERAWLWARRSPVVAGLLALVALSLLGGAVVGTTFGLIARHQAARADAERQRAGKFAALTAFRAGQEACDRGEVGAGLLTLARALRELPAGEEDLERVFRSSLAWWATRSHTLEDIELRDHTPAESDHERRLLREGERSPELRPGPKEVVASWGDGGGRRELVGVGGRAPVSRVAGQADQPLPHDSEILSAAFSADGRLLVTGAYNGTAGVWDVARRTRQASVPLHQSDIVNVTFAGPGRVRTASRDGTTKTWRLPAGLFPQAEFEQPGAVTALALSPNGTTVAAGSADGLVRRWRLATGRLAGEPIAPGPTPGIPSPGLRLPVRALAFSPDGQTLAVGAGSSPDAVWIGRTDLLDAATGRRVRPPFVHLTSVTALAFTPDGSDLLVTCYDGSATLWSPRTGTPRLPLTGATPGRQPLAACTVSPDGRRALVGGYDRVVTCWDTQAGREVGPALRHDGQILGTAWAGPGAGVILTGGSDRTARLWDGADGELLHPPLPHPDEVTAVALSADGSLAFTGCRDGKARIWDVTTGLPIVTLPAHQGAVTGVALLGEPLTFLTSGADGLTRAWAGVAPTTGTSAELERHVRRATGLTSPAEGLFAPLSRDEWQALGD